MLSYVAGRAAGAAVEPFARHAAQNLAEKTIPTRLQPPHIEQKRSHHEVDFQYDQQPEGTRFGCSFASTTETTTIRVVEATASVGSEHSNSPKQEGKVASHGVTQKQSFGQCKRCGAELSCDIRKGFVSHRCPSCDDLPATEACFDGCWSMVWSMRSTPTARESGRSMMEEGRRHGGPVVVADQRMNQARSSSSRNHDSNRKVLEVKKCIKRIEQCTSSAAEKRNALNTLQKLCSNLDNGASERVRSVNYEKVKDHIENCDGFLHALDACGWSLDESETFRFNMEEIKHQGKYRIQFEAAGAALK